MTTNKSQTYLEKATETIKLEDQNRKNIDRFATYQEARVKAHGRAIAAPIFKEEGTGRLLWANRKARRKAARTKK